MQTWICPYTHGSVHTHMDLSMHTWICPCTCGPTHALRSVCAHVDLSVPTDLSMSVQIYHAHVCRHLSMHIPANASACARVAPSVQMDLSMHTWTDQCPWIYLSVHTLADASTPACSDGCPSCVYLCVCPGMSMHTDVQGPELCVCVHRHGRVSEGCPCTSRGVVCTFTRTQVPRGAQTHTGVSVCICARSEGSPVCAHMLISVCLYTRQRAHRYTRVSASRLCVCPWLPGVTVGMHGWCLSLASAHLCRHVCVCAQA